MTHVPETYAGAPDPRGTLDSLDAASAYAQGKRASETMCVQEQQAAVAKGAEFEAKIARCWAFVGPHLPLNAHFAIGNFIGDVLAGRPTSIGADGPARNKDTTAADLAVWLWTILLRAQQNRP